MQFRTFFAQDESGNTVASASASVYVQGTQTPISIFDIDGNSITNPIVSGASGKIAFAAVDGVYDLLITAGSRSYSSVIEFLDVKDSIQQVATLTDQAILSASNALDSELLAFDHKEESVVIRDFVAALYDDFDTKYLGAKSSEPTTDNNGDPIAAGALYFNTITQSLNSFRNDAWVGIDVGSFAETLASNAASQGASLIGVENGNNLQEELDNSQQQLDDVNLDIAKFSSDEVGEGASLVLLEDASNVEDAVSVLRASALTFLEKPSERTVTGTATFTKSTNNIALTGIGSIGLEIGDVVQVTGTASNNKLFTVEVITDADNVIVNQAHAGGTTSKSLVDETVSTTVTLVVKWYNAAPGLGQGVVNLNASRSFYTTYTNNTKREISIYINVANASNNDVFFNLDGKGLFEIIENPAGSKPTISMLVPPDSTYRITETGMTIINWSETR